MGKAVVLWHEIRRLELALSAPTLDVSDAESIRREIREKTAQREAFLKDGRRLSRPANRDVAEMVGLTEEKAEQVSTLLIRARDMLRNKMDRRGSR